MRLRRTIKAGAAERAARDAGFPSDITGLPDADDAAPVSRRDARSVPAVTGALQILSGNAAALSLRRFDHSGNAIEPGTFIAHPEPDEQRPLSLTVRRTVEDMALGGVGYWRVILRDYSGRPLAALRLDPDTVAPRIEYVAGVGPVVLDWQVDSNTYPPRDLLAFYGPVEGGWCQAGARAIRSSIALEKAAKKYAEEPLPSIVLKNRSGVDLPEPAVDAILAKWKDSRTKRTTAYVNASLDVDSMGFNARDLQLVEGRQQNVLEIARLANLPSGMLASAAAGTSLTYSNVESERLKVLAAIMPYLVAIESRLSGEDCTPRGQTVRFDLQSLSRPDSSTIVRMVHDLVPLDVLDHDEARAFLGLPNRAGSPAALPTPGNSPTAAAPAAAPLRLVGSRLTSTAIAARVAGAPGAVAVADDRTVSGLVVPWGVAARVQGSDDPVLFLRSSLTAGDGVRLILHHDLTRPVGRPLAYSDDVDGLRATFALGSSSLALDAALDVNDGVLDGFSVGVDVLDGYYLDGTVYVSAASLREVSLVTLPAYTTARVGAAQQMKGANMPAPKRNDGAAPLLSLEANDPPAAPLPPGAVPLTANDPAIPRPAPAPAPAPAAAPPAAPGAPVAASDPPAPPSPAVPGAVAPAPAADPSAQPLHLADVLAAMGVPIPPGGVRVVREESPYRPDIAATERIGFFADLVHARDGDADARTRSLKFEAQLGDYRRLMAAANTTANSGQIIPPAWGGRFAVEQIEQGRPAVTAFSSAGIDDPRPFSIPGYGSTTPAQLVAEHVEGVNPAAGQVNFIQLPVTPKGYSGIAQASRELLDSSPVLADQMISEALAESWSQVTEAVFAALLVAGSTDSGAGPGDAIELEAALRAVIGGLPSTRFAVARAVLVDAGAYGLLVSSDAADGRPLVPYAGYGPQNAAAVAGAALATAEIAGVPTRPAWSLAGTSIVGAGAMDAMTFESNRLTFRFEEKNGPALIDFACFGYFGGVVRRPLGVVRVDTSGLAAAVTAGAAGRSGRGSK